MTDRFLPSTDRAARPADALRRRIAAALRANRFGRPLHVYALAASTNDLARDLAAAGAPEGTAVLALEQSAGRGRLGRRWVSPRGGLYLSLVLRPRFPVERWPLIGLAAAVGAAAAADATLAGAAGRTEAGPTPEAAAPVVRVKWPNDLLLDGRKLGGILTEVAGDAAICGIGINVAPLRSDPVPGGPRRPGGPARPDGEGASPRLAEGVAEAAWLAARNPAASVEALAPLVLAEVERRYARLEDRPAEVLDEWRGRADTLGRWVRLEAPEMLEGVAVDVDADGALIVETATGRRRVRSGDVIAHRADPTAEGGAPAAPGGNAPRGGER